MESMQDIMKKEDVLINIDADDLIKKVVRHNFKLSSKAVTICVIALLFCGFGLTSFIKHALDDIDDVDGISISYVYSPAAAGAKKNYISIPSGTIKANPFLPYRVLDKDSSSRVSDVPAFELIAPPEEVNENSDAARVMDTIVSGILYDKFSPSAILNIEGNDYLVKKGDVVNNYKVLDITRNSVSVKLGTNTYKAGIGEILTEGTVNHNDVSNLSSKFGGEKR